MKKLTCLPFLYFALMTHSPAQDLSVHQWQNRLVLLFAEDISDPVFRQQLAELHSDPEGLNERKLLVFQITPEKYLSGDSTNGEWMPTSTLYRQYQTPGAPFTIVLIGLDGGVKLSETSFVPKEKLFTLIDGMPMRKAEIKRRQ